MRLKAFSIKEIDVRTAIAVGICVATVYVMTALDLNAYYQAMTAAISVLLCSLDNRSISWKSGLTRLAVTAIGGIMGICAVALDDIIQVPIIFVLLCILGILLTLALCQVAGLPYINCKIGGVTFVLVVLTRQGSERMTYAIFRFVSTFYGVVIVVGVAAVWELFQKLQKRE